MKILKNILNSNKLFLILLFIIAIITTLNWYKVRLPIGNGDEYWLYNPALLEDMMKYLWDTKFFSTGWYNFSIAQFFPIVLYWIIMTKLGFSLWLTQYIWFVTVSFCGGLTFYYLALLFLEKTFGKRTEYSFSIILKLSAFLGAYYYTYNIVSLQLLPYHPYLRTVAAGLPIMLLLFIKYHSSKKYVYLILCALASLIFAQANVNFAYTIPAFLIIYLYALFEMILDKTKIKSYLLSLVILSVLIVLFNLWWISPLIMSQLGGSGDIRSTLNIWNAIDGKNMSEYFRLLGFWAWNDGTNDYDYFPYHIHYENILFYIIGYGLIAFPLIAVAVKPSKYTRFLLLVFVLGIFFAKGLNGPFGQVFSILFNNFPMFWVFRDPFSKFGTLLVFSITLLFSISVMWLLLKVKRPLLQLISTSILFICVSVYSYPIFTGEYLLLKNDAYRMSHFVDVPETWKKYESENMSKVLFGLPSYYGTQYKWNYGFNGLPFTLFTKTDVYEDRSYTYSPGQKLLSSGFSELLNYQDPKFLKFLNLFNISKIAISNDLKLDDEQSSNIIKYYDSELGPANNHGLKIYNLPNPSTLFFLSSDIVFTDSFQNSWKQGLDIFNHENYPVFVDLKDSNRLNVIAPFYISVTPTEVSNRTNDAKLFNTLSQTTQLPMHMFYRFDVPDQAKDPKINLTKSFISVSGLDFKYYLYNDKGEELFNKQLRSDIAGEYKYTDDFILAPGTYTAIIAYDNSKLRKTITFSETGETIQLSEIKQKSFYKNLIDFNYQSNYLFEIPIKSISGILDISIYQKENLSNYDLENSPNLFRCYNEPGKINNCNSPILVKWKPSIKSNSANIVIHSHHTDRYVPIKSLGTVELTDLVVEEYFDPTLTIVIDNPNINDSSYIALADQKYDPTKYTVKIPENVSSELLVFNNSFHPAWKLKVNGNEVPASKHLSVNGYANAWILDDVNVSGSDVKVEFIYQKYFRITSIISVAIILTSIGYSFYELLIRKQK